MQTITKYKADDGLEFSDKLECSSHELNCEMAQLITCVLPDIPEGCGFSNGSGYIQHDQHTFNSAYQKFLKFCTRYIDHKWLTSAINGEDVHVSDLNRILGETLPSTIYNEFYRFYCTDKSFREWGQPYFAHNENHDRKMVQLN